MTTQKVPAPQPDRDDETVRLADPVTEDSSVSLVEMANVILRQRALILGILGAALIVGLFVALRTPTVYEVDAAFLPEQSSSGSGSTTTARILAQRFGFGGPSVGERTPEFYANLLRSEEILRQTVEAEYVLPEADTVIDLRQWLAPSATSEAERTELAIRRLRGDMSVGVSLETGVVTYSVVAADPHLAQQIAATVLERVGAFDLETRQSQARSERIFAEERLEELKSELRTAEDELRQFLDENRNFQNSPSLLFQHERLMRSVQLRQELAVSMAEAFENARIDEVRNTPVITLIQPPRVPATRRPKRRPVKVIMALVMGGIVGILAAFAREYFLQVDRANGRDVREFRRLWRSLFGRLRSHPGS